jgi:hypothetical protein
MPECDLFMICFDLVVQQGFLPHVLFYQTNSYFKLLQLPVIRIKSKLSTKCVKTRIMLGFYTLG